MFIPTKLSVIAVIIYCISYSIHRALALTCAQLNCDFRRDLCLWSNNTDNMADLPWIRGISGLGLLVPENGTAGAKGRLVSRWLDPQPGHSCQLKFQIANFLYPTQCRLSVVQEVKIRAGKRETLDPRVIWTSTELDYKVVTHYANFDCTVGTLYRVYFELDDTTACAAWLIVLDNVSCQTMKLSATPSPTTTPPTTIQPPAPPPPIPQMPTSPSTSQTTSSGEVEPHTGLRSAAVTGIVIAVVVVAIAVAVIMVIVFSVRRRQTKKSALESDYHEYIEILPDPMGVTPPRNQRAQLPVTSGHNTGSCLTPTDQNSTNTAPHKSSNEDTAYSKPYELPPASKNARDLETYQKLSQDRASDHVYTTVDDGKRDADGYEMPMTRDPQPKE